MHHHADRAMVGIGIGGVDVNDLDKCNQSQQQQTQKRTHAHNPGVAPVRPLHSEFAADFHPVHAYYK